MARDDRCIRFFDPVALAELNRALKWQRRYRRLRKLVMKLQQERRGHLRLIDHYEWEIAFHERHAVVLRRMLSHRRCRYGRWDDANMN